MLPDYLSVSYDYAKAHRIMRVHTARNTQRRAQAASHEAHTGSRTLKSARHIKHVEPRAVFFELIISCKQLKQKIRGLHGDTINFVLFFCSNGIE